VRDAPVVQVEAAITAVTWPEQRAPRIQHVLREITRLRGELSLDFLAELSVAEARRWLEALLPEGLTAQEVYDNHEVLMLHGQQCCYYRAPACHRCVVYALCPTGQRLRPEVAATLGDTLLQRPA
jgi:endonuclease-3